MPCAVLLYGMHHSRLMCTDLLTSEQRALNAWTAKLKSNDVRALYNIFAISQDITGCSIVIYMLYPHFCGISQYTLHCGDT